MESLAETNNGRIVKLSEVDFIVTPTKKGGKETLIKKPTFRTDVKSFQLGEKTIPCTRDAGQLFGLYLGDGWVDKSRKLMHIASIHTEIIEVFKREVNTYIRAEDSDVEGFHLKNRQHQFDGYTCTHGKFSINIKTPERLAMMEIFGHGAHNKTIPDYLLHTPEEFRWGLLGGLIDTDGTVAIVKRKTKTGREKISHHFKYSTTSRSLADKIQLLGFSLGINTSVNKIQHKSGVVEFPVYFSIKHVTELRENIHLLHPEKKAALQKFAVTEMVYNKDIIPIDWDIYEEIKKNFELSETNKSVLRRVCRRGFSARESFAPYYSGAVKKIYDSRYEFNAQYERVERIIFPDIGDLYGINKA